VTTRRQGDRGRGALELQTLLAMTGHDPGPLDGIFGPKTLAALGTVASWGATSAAPPLLDGLRALPRHGVELPRMLTPVSAVDMRIALVAGYADAFPGHDVDATSVRVALAQFCVEHGCEAWLPKLTVAPWLSLPLHEQAYIYVWNNNVGNRQVRAEDRERSAVAATCIDPGPIAAQQPRLDPHGTPAVPWFSMSPMEGSGASAHRATSAHYAYPNVAEGAAAYWRFMRDRCAPALAAFEAGDPATAAHELKHGAWSYSGDETAYARAMVDRFARIQ
jgi:hypothetical protein